mmetsp:Transcript_60551/g.141016  ORF Transcript_60551/g.141016 Transcript_60551/m.141016 type:complete len:139 (-) Transcript_60551:158-574(-)
MNWSKPTAKDNPNLSFQKWLQIHDEKEGRAQRLKVQSQKMRAFADVGKHSRNHLAVGDPIGEFIKDKAMHAERRRLGTAFGTALTPADSERMSFATPESEPPFLEGGTLRLNGLRQHPQASRVATPESANTRPRRLAA